MNPNLPPWDAGPPSDDCADPRRLAVLESFGILDTPREQEFDDLCRFAAQLCDTPMAVINFLDSERQWFKSEVGLGTRQHPLIGSVCRHTIQQQAVLVVPDLCADPRFADHLPEGQGVPLRFYAGAVIRTPEGVALGTVCVFDHQPRQLEELQTQALQTLARQVATLLDLRRQAHDARQLAATRGEINVHLTGTAPLRETLQHCTQTIVDYLQGAFARLWTLDEAAATLVLQASAGCYTHLDGPHGRVKVGEFKIGRIARDRQPLLTNDVQHDPNISDPAWALREHMVAFAGYPLLIEGRTVGVLAVFWRRAVSTALLEDLAPIAQSIAQFVERKANEGALVQIAEQRRLALDSAQMGWWHLNLLTNQVQSDERFKKIFGTQREEFAFEQGLNMIHPEDRAGVEAAVKAATHPQHPVPYAIEHRVIHDDGAVRWVQLRGQAHLAEEGETRRAVSLVGTILDITEAKAARDALHESEARFRQIADAMPQIVFAGGPDGHLDYYNKQWYDYTGLPPGSTGNEAWDELLHPDDFERTLEIYAAALRSGTLYEHEFRLKRASDGAYRWFLGRALPIKDAAGNVLRWFGTDTDIHERKQLQEQNEQLLASERAARSEAERTSHMKDEFLATLSHELRTPLNAILGWSQVLRDGHADSEDLNQGLATIERNARAQTQIIEDLLDMSRIVAGKVRLDVQRIELAPVLEAALETMRPTADAKGIRLQAVLDPQALPISGDPNRLQQVFWNLLSNAIKFTPKGGRVQVVLERIHSHLEVSISDTGQGIDAAFLPHVFDRFRQADATTTRQHGGLGLGLAIVKQLVELHGGGVRVKSAGLGQGTTFCITFPLKVLHAGSEPDENERRHPQASSLAAPMPGRGSLKLQGVEVLVVDDEVDARALVKRLLEDRGAKVRTAGSATEALRLIGEARPDVLVSDIGMPGEDGYALIRRVRALTAAGGGAVPAIALTAYARAEDRMKAILAGFQMHVAKPVEPAELLTMVASLAGRTGSH